MKKIGLVIDSTTILDQEIIKKYNIKVVSLNVLIEGVTKKEADTNDQEIIDRLSDVANLKSASPSPQDFIAAYEELFEDGYEDIIVVPLSKELSTTYQCANIAKQSIDQEDHVYIIDTNICNFGNANLIETILPLFDTVEDVKELVKEFETRSKNSNVQFTILELKHLVRGGRLSKLSGTFGTLFRIKPIVEMIDGSLKLQHKVRTFPAVFDIFLKKIEEFSNAFKNVFLKVVYLGNEGIANSFINQVKEKCPNVVISTIKKINPVFLIHLGNNGIGIALTAYN